MPIGSQSTSKSTLIRACTTVAHHGTTIFAGGTAQIGSNRSHLLHSAHRTKLGETDSQQISFKSEQCSHSAKPQICVWVGNNKWFFVESKFCFCVFWGIFFVSVFKLLFLDLLSEHLFPAALGQYQQCHAELIGGEQPRRRTGRPRRWNPQRTRTWWLDEGSADRLNPGCQRLAAGGGTKVFDADMSKQLLSSATLRTALGPRPSRSRFCPACSAAETKQNLAGDDTVFWILHNANTRVGKILPNHRLLMQLHPICVFACWGDKEIVGFAWTPVEQLNFNC